MKFLKLLVLFLISFNLNASPRAIMGEEIRNSSNGVLIWNISTGAISVGYLKTDGSGNFSSVTSIPGSDISNTPAGNISATNVQSAINELDSEKQATGNYITVLTGDGTASGPGSAALVFATVNANVGSFGSASSVGTFTVNSKGLITAAGSTSIQIAESQVTNLVTDLSGKQSTLVNSAGLAAALSDETGTGFSVFSVSPALTGSPTAPTQTASDNSTKIATTAYADAKVVDAINDAVTAIAPSENAVFDALALKVNTSAFSSKILYVNRESGNDANSCTINAPCLTIQRGIDVAIAIPSTFNTPILLKVSPGKYTEDISLSQQGLTIQCEVPLYHTDSCQLYGGITINLSGTAGGGNFVASNNNVSIDGLEVFASGAKNALLFSGTAFQRLIINQSFITQSSVNSANSALLMSNTGTSGGTKSTITARDTDFSNNSSTNAAVEIQAGRLFDNGSSLDLSNSSTARTALLINGSAAAGPSVFIDHASITGLTSVTDNTAVLQYSLVAQSCGSAACITLPSSPSTGFFIGGDNSLTTTNTNVIAGTGVAVLSGSNYCGSTGCAIAGTVTQVPLVPLPQGILKPSGLLVSGLTASKLVKTDASKNLVSYDLVSGDITTALGYTPQSAITFAALQSSNFTAACNKIYPIGASVSVQLPALVANCEVVIKNTAAFTVTILQSGAELIDEVNGSYIFSDNKKAIRIVVDSTGTKRYIL